MSERECLQCGETKASIKAKRIVLCGIEEGYEYRELAHEWPRHRWADWTDADLRRFGVKPEAFEKHRRTDALSFQWIDCADTVRGHRPAEKDDPEFGMKRGQCWLCGKSAAEVRSTDTTAHDLDRMGICRHCGQGITAKELLDGEERCDTTGAET